MSSAAQSAGAVQNSPRRRVLVVLALLLGVAGCATPPPPPAPRTTVVLLPDEDGQVGRVDVKGASGTQRIDEAYTATVVQGGRAAAVDRIGKERVGETYAKLLDAQPKKPRTFMLNFLLDKTVLTEESKAQIPEVLQAIRERKPTEITVFGHTDSTGSELHNLKLSADRARAIAALLKKNDPTLDSIDVQWFGASVPLVKSDRKEEARNRRAEIQIL